MAGISSINTIVLLVREAVAVLSRSYASNLGKQLIVGSGDKTIRFFFWGCTITQIRIHWVLQSAAINGPWNYQKDGQGTLLLGDRYIGYTLAQIFVPFSSSYEPLWVGLGQVGFYVMLIVTLSFYVRSHIGQKTGRSLHYVSFFTYLIALIHGIAAGSDSALPWVQQYYWISSGALLFLLCYRIVANLSAKPALSST